MGYRLTQRPELRFRGGFEGPTPDSPVQNTLLNAHFQHAVWDFYHRSRGIVLQLRARAPQPRPP